MQQSLFDAKAWLRLLDAPAAALSDQLAAVGIRNPPVVPADMATIYVAVEKAGFELAFMSADLAPRHEVLKPTAAVLTGLLLPLDTYKRRLPLGIQRRDSRASLRKRLGRPRRTNPGRDLWMLDGRSVEVEYTEDLAKLLRISILLP